jgi:glucokinase
VLGLDIGGTKLAAGVVEPGGATRSFVVEPTGVRRPTQIVLDELIELGNRAVAESGLDWKEIDAVGIGCGGPLDADEGILLAPPHLPGWRDVPVVDIVEQAYGRPAMLENDATAGAAGEHRYGAGVGVAHMVYLTLSTGVGGGVVIDHKLYRGAVGNGGELGHVTIDWHGRMCRSCGRRGCLEAYASGTSLAERAVESMDPSSVLAGFVANGDGGGSGVTAAQVAAAARAGDPYANRIWDETIYALACGLTSIVNLFEPELVVLGGGLTQSGDQLLAPVREFVHEQAMAPVGRSARIVLATLGDRVGVVGAAAVVYGKRH